MGSFGFAYLPVPRFTLPALAATLIATAALPASARAHDASRTWSTEVSASGLRSVDFDLAVGSLRVEGTKGSSVRLRVDARCDDEWDRGCEDALGRLRIHKRVHGDRLQLEIRGLSKGLLDDLDIEVTLEMPRGLALDLDMGAGELEIDGLEDGIDVDMGVGEATIRIPERAVRSVEMTVGIGEVSLIRGGRKHEYVRILSSPVRWMEGSGRSRVDVSLGVGEAEVTLR